MPKELERDFPIVVAAMPVTGGQRKAAIAVILALLVTAIVSAPFAHLQPGRLDAFIPVLQTVICIADLVTAIFLFAQYTVQPRGAILVLAAAYICSGMFAFIQTLAFPGAYAETGLIGDGRNSAGWFFVWWHTTFPMAVIIYALLKDQTPLARAPNRPAAVMIGITLMCAAALIAGLTGLAIAGTSYLPDLFTTSVTISMPVANQINLVLWALNAIAILIVFFRMRTILDLWLIVTLFAWMPNFIIAAMLTIHRFSMGWYTARGFALFASCVMLVVLLIETTLLYARLANAVALSRRERANRLMSLDAATGAMAHEIRQPLTGIISASSAGANWLKATPPNIEKLHSCLATIKDAAFRADEIIASVRKLFKEGTRERRPVSLNAVAQEALNLMRQDLLRNQIDVSADFAEDLPNVYGDNTQLQQVVLNLVKNSIDSMEASPPGRRELSLASATNGHSVTLSVRDSGRGIGAAERDQVFESFFTTKTEGMGLGLFVSQTIVGQHGGELRLAQADSSGCTFEISMPPAAESEVAA